MNNNTILKECADPTQSIKVELPCVMAEKVIKLTDKKETTLSNILIEALDDFLRKQR